MPATPSPVAAYAASVMWSVCENAAGFAIAANGLTLMAFPPMTSNPVGAFIHAFAMTTKMPGQHAAQRDDDARPRDARPGSRAIPAVEVDPEEDRFGEEREPLERKRHADDRSGESHEVRPQEPELEREHGA